MQFTRKTKLIIKLRFYTHLIVRFFTLSRCKFRTKTLFFAFIFIFLFDCTRTKESKKEKFFLAEFLYINLTNSNAINRLNTCTQASSDPALTVIEFFHTNLRSIELFYKNNFVITSTIQNESIYFTDSSKMDLIILFETNEFISHLRFYSNGIKFCKVELYKNKVFKEIVEKDFDLNLNDFTELTIGDYRIIANR